MLERRSSRAPSGSRGRALQEPQGQANRGGPQVPPAAKDMDIAQARRSLLLSQQEIGHLEGANQALMCQVQNGPPAALAAIKNVAPIKVPFWAGTLSDPPVDVCLDLLSGQAPRDQQAD